MSDLLNESEKSYNEKSIQTKLILATPIFLLLTHYLAVFPHEYAHSFMAWLLGYKANPFALDYGGTSLLNVLLLAHINENVNYSAIYSSGHASYVSFIAFAGPGIANSLLFIVSYFLLKMKKIIQKPFLYYFLFLFNLMCLGSFYDYVPIRTFAKSGDIYNFITGLNISPWLVYIIFGYLVAFLIWQFFSKTLISTYLNLDLKTILPRSSLMIICVLILFGFFGGYPYIYFIGRNDVGDITYFLSATSFIAIPGIIIALWPTRMWVNQRLAKALLEGCYV